MTFMFQIPFCVWMDDKAAAEQVSRVKHLPPLRTPEALRILNTYNQGS